MGAFANAFAPPLAAKRSKVYRGEMKSYIEIVNSGRPVYALPDSSGAALAYRAVATLSAL